MLVVSSSAAGGWGITLIAKGPGAMFWWEWGAALMPCDKEHEMVKTPWRDFFLRERTSDTYRFFLESDWHGNFLSWKSMYTFCAVPTAVSGLRTRPVGETCLSPTCKARASFSQVGSACLCGHEPSRRTCATIVVFYEAICSRRLHVVSRTVVLDQVFSFRRQICWRIMWRLLCVMFIGVRANTINGTTGKCRALDGSGFNSSTFLMNKRAVSSDAAVCKRRDAGAVLLSAVLRR